MKTTTIIATVMSILIYIIAIEETVQLFFSPNPEFDIIFQGFRQHTVTIELVIILMALSMIPAFFFIKRECNEVQLGKVPIQLILIFSTILPVLAFVNDYFTGDLLFSAALIVFGVIFIVVAYRFR